MKHIRQTLTGEAPHWHYYAALTATGCVAMATGLRAVRVAAATCPPPNFAPIWQTALGLAASYAATFALIAIGLAACRDILEAIGERQ